tara:strand:+ start:979 stop:1464 length:486 start_codon:yes stop_codon:yes gene_type:complete
MNISTQKLKQIIIEEYVKEEGIDESQAAEDLLRQLIGDEEYNRRRALENPDSRGGDTAAMDKPNKAAETMPMPSDQTNLVKATVDGVYALVSDMDPEDVQEIFQIVFERLPGVEMMSPGDEDYPEQPPTEYVRGAGGRPKISSFGLDEIKQLIRKVLAESV